MSTVKPVPRSYMLNSNDIETREFVIPHKRDTDNDDTEEGQFVQNETNSAKKAGELAAGSLGITLFGVFMLAAGTVSFLLAYLVPLSIITGGLVVSTVGHNQWKDAVANFDDPSRVNQFVDNVNIYEFTQNFFFTLTEIAIIVFDYSLGLLYLLFAFFYNLAVFIFKYVFAVVAPYLIPIFTALTRVAVQVMVGLTGAFGQLNQDNPGNFGSTAEETTQNDMDDTASRFFQVVNAIINFMNSMESTQWHEFVNFLMDPFFKNIAQFFYFVSNLAAILGKSGAWSKLTALGAQASKIGDVLQSSLCQVEKFGNQVTCAISYGAYYTICPLYSIAFQDCPIDNPHCDVNGGGSCSDPNSKSATAQEQQASSAAIEAIFGAALCDEIECEFFVEDLFTVFNQTINTCSFWVTNPNIMFDCMVMVTNYRNANYTSPKQANPATIAVEICFVALVYNIESCQDYGRPFIFPFAEASNDICNNTRYGASFAECSCKYPAPLCDPTCCHKYGDHVNLQVLGQIGSYTCASLTSTFSPDKAWCPLTSPQNLATVARNNTRSPFPDNTYAFMWCSYFQNVLYPACQTVASFTLIRDLVNINSVMPDYKTGACNLTVNQVSVCVPVNTTIDSLAMNIIGTNVSTIGLYIATNNIPAPTTGEAIPTIFELGDNAQTIIQKTRNKHMCQQYGEQQKAGNMISLSQPWSIDFVITEYCDNDLALASTNDLSGLTVSSFYKYREPNGNPIPKDLAGVPSTWNAFGDAANPNSETQACTSEHGLNQDEKQDLDQCVEALRVESYANNEQLVASTDSTLEVFDTQENYTSDFYSSTGLVPIDPNATNAAELEQQVERTDNAVNADVDFVDPPYQDLPNVTQEFRYNYSSPPPDYSPDSNNPGAPFFFGPKTHDTNNIGRVVLSVHTGKPVAPNYYKNSMQVLFGIEDKEDNKNKKKKKEEGEERDKEPPLFPPINAQSLVGITLNVVEKGLVYMFGKPTKQDQAYAEKMRRRLERKAKYLEEELYLKIKRQYEAEGHSLDDVDYFPTARALLSTGDVMLDSALADLLYAISNTPHTPLGTSPENYNIFLENQLKSRALYIYRVTLTKVLPGILLNLLTFYNTRSPENTIPMENILELVNSVFGSEQSEPSCRNTMSDPYRCCAAATTSYDCCRGLVFCIPNLPQWLWITPTTSETLDKWYCTDVDSFWSWWRWFLKLALSIVASLIKYATGFDQFIGTSLDSLILHENDIPENIYSCMLATSIYFWYGALAVYGIYFFITVQVLTLFILLFANFRQQQALMDDTVANLQAQIKKFKERLTDKGFRNLKDININAPILK